jgi:hypothetical protein
VVVGPSGHLREEELGELLSELRPVPVDWVVRALAIGGAVLPSDGSQETADPSEVRAPAQD